LKKQFSLDAILALPADEQDDAIAEMAAQFAADGVTIEEIEELEGLVHRLNELIGQRARPN
jgi:hypothetical protein